MFDAPQSRSHRERDADYHGVIHTSDAWPVTICTTRQSLIRLWESDVGGPAPILALLPEHASRFNLADWRALYETT